MDGLGKNISNFFVLDHTKHAHAQGGQRSLREYLERWRAWALAGLPSIVDVEGVDAAVESILRKAVTSSSRFQPKSYGPVRRYRPVDLCKNLSTTVKENQHGKKIPPDN